MFCWTIVNKTFWSKQKHKICTEQKSIVETENKGINQKWHHYVSKLNGVVRWTFELSSNEHTLHTLFSFKQNYLTVIVWQYFQGARPSTGTTFFLHLGHNSFCQNVNTNNFAHHLLLVIKIPVLQIDLFHINLVNNCDFRFF